MVVDHDGRPAKPLCCHGGFFCLRRSVLGDFCSNGCLPQSRLRLRLFWIFCKEFACFWTATLGPRSSPFIFANHFGRWADPLFELQGISGWSVISITANLANECRSSRAQIGWEETKRCIFYQRKIIETKRCHVVFNCCCTPLFFACDALLGSGTLSSAHQA